MRPSYYFIFCPNNSGTTIMSQYLAAQVDGYLPPFGYNEGQNAPSVQKMMREKVWDKNHPYDWKFIHAEWDALCIEAGKDTFVEASPPNLTRIDAIREEFDPVAKYICAISSPYTQISSCIFNYSKGPFAPRMLTGGVHRWVKKAQAIRQAMLDDPSVPLLRYEDFCAAPTQLNALLELPVREIGGLEGKGNTRERTIRDFSNRNIHFLSVSEIDQLTELLRPHQDLLDHFRLPLLDGRQSADAAKRNEPDLYRAAKKRRTRWRIRTIKRKLGRLT